MTSLFQARERAGRAHSDRPPEAGRPRRSRGRVSAILALLLLVQPAAAVQRAGDVLTALAGEYVKADGNANRLIDGSDESYARWVLDTPDFPYSGLRRVWLPQADEATLRAIASLSTPTAPLNHRDLHDMKVWDLGFTRSRPGYEITEIPDAYRAMARPGSLVKAGIDMDIYQKAGELVGAEFPAIAANYALGAQLLRARLAETPSRLWRHRGLRHDVLDRFLSTEESSTLQDFDLHYLIQLLDGDLAVWTAGGSSIHGLRQLPTGFRLARAAAAYQDRLAYVQEPCGADGGHDPGHDSAEIGAGRYARELCFDDATDRAVHAWYGAQLHHELATAPHVREGAYALERAAAPLLASRQGWIGLHRPDRIALTMRTEVIEAKIIDTLLSRGEATYLEASEVLRRALRLVCTEGAHP